MSSNMKINQLPEQSVFSLSHVIPFFQMAKLKGNNQIIHGSDRSIPPPPTLLCHVAVSSCELPITHTHTLFTSFYDLDPPPPVQCSNRLYGFVSGGCHFMLNPGSGLRDKKPRTAVLFAGRRAMWLKIGSVL